MIFNILHLWSICIIQIRYSINQGIKKSVLLNINHSTYCFDCLITNIAVQDSKMPPSSFETHTQPRQPCKFSDLCPVLIEMPAANVV